MGRAGWDGLDGTGWLGRGHRECFHRTLLHVHLRMKRGTTGYTSLDETKTDLDQYLELYKSKRP